MTERMSADEFMDMCGGLVNGYAVFDDEKCPETYDELIAFVGKRINLDSKYISLAGLSEWLMAGGEYLTSCMPAMDSEHVAAVILMSDLSDADAFVASLPLVGDGLLMPPPDMVRRRVTSQNN